MSGQSSSENLTMEQRRPSCWYCLNSARRWSLASDDSVTAATNAATLAWKAVPSVEFSVNAAPESASAVIIYLPGRYLIVKLCKRRNRR